MDIQQLVTDWRQTYSEWVSTELALRAARQHKTSGPMVPRLEEKIRQLKCRCSECQDAMSRALSAEHANALAQSADEH